MTKDSAEEKLIRINCDRAGAIFSKIWGFLPGTNLLSSPKTIFEKIPQKLLDVKFKLRPMIRGIRKKQARDKDIQWRSQAREKGRRLRTKGVSDKVDFPAPMKLIRNGVTVK